MKKILDEPINISGDAENFFGQLRDGILFNKLAKAPEEGSVRKIVTSQRAFRCMENISCFWSREEHPWVYREAAQREQDYHFPSNGIEQRSQSEWPELWQHASHVKSHWEIPFVRSSCVQEYTKNCHEVILRSSPSLTSSTGSKAFIQLWQYQQNGDSIDNQIKQRQCHYVPTLLRTSHRNFWST